MEEQLTIEQALIILSLYDDELRIEEGFNRPHSYRGIYDELGVQPCTNTTVSEMKNALHAAMKYSFSGWRGGDYSYYEDTPIWLAIEGISGVPLTESWLQTTLARSFVNDKIK